ncbi:hypothetical protein TNCV_3862291 [Trichonephila clavipes]|nr:hypothetical protein TNCV_3862291 [Trichonephila clavipes]
MSGDKFNKIRAGNGRKTSVNDREKIISWTSIRSNGINAAASASSKIIRNRLEDVRLKGRVFHKKAVSQFTAALKGTTVDNGTH